MEGDDDWRNGSRIAGGGGGWREGEGGRVGKGAVEGRLVGGLGKRHCGGVRSCAALDVRIREVKGVHVHGLGWLERAVDRYLLA